MHSFVFDLKSVAVDGWITFYCPSFIVPDKVSPICVLQQKRACDLVTVGPPEAMDGRLPTRTVVIMARVHPGETPTSYIVKGEADSGL